MDRILLVFPALQNATKDLQRMREQALDIRAEIRGLRAHMQQMKDPHLRSHMEALLKQEIHLSDSIEQTAVLTDALKKTMAIFSETERSIIQNLSGVSEQSMDMRTLSDFMFAPEPKGSRQIGQCILEDGQRFEAQIHPAWLTQAANAYFSSQ